jgi:hypothetical protein
MLLASIGGLKGHAMFFKRFLGNLVTNEVVNVLKKEDK